jgi:hypothetical protein
MQGWALHGTQHHPNVKQKAREKSDKQRLLTVSAPQKEANPNTETIVALTRKEIKHPGILHREDVQNDLKMACNIFPC